MGCWAWRSRPTGGAACRAMRSPRYGCGRWGSDALPARETRRMTITPPPGFARRHEEIADVHLREGPFSLLPRLDAGGGRPWPIAGRLVRRAGGGRPRRQDLVRGARRQGLVGAADDRLG